MMRSTKQFVICQNDLPIAVLTLGAIEEDARKIVEYYKTKEPYVGGRTNYFWYQECEIVGGLPSENR